jgi:CubicO group peptidase (beta-lactamase class C family)
MPAVRAAVIDPEICVSSGVPERAAAEPEVMSAAVVDGALAAGAIDDPSVPWWSFTKTVLAAAALVLVDAGRLALDHPLSGRAYTLRQLLQHRAGVPDYGGWKQYHDAVAAGGPPWSVEELLDRARVLRAFPPETTWIYSNIGYLFVRQLIERTMQEPIGEAVARLVLAPLGIDNVSVAVTPDDLGGTRWGNPTGYHPGWVYHGLLLGPPAAAALFLDRLMRGDLLSRTSIKAMRSSFPIPIEPAPVPVAPPPERPWLAPAYGLGLMMETAAGRDPFMGHSGEGTTNAAVYHFPARRPAVTVGIFAPTRDIGLVERRAVAAARALQD